MARNQKVSVEEFMATLSHPFREEIETIRRIILNVDPAVTEQIKWNAPSFSYHNDDRITFRLSAGRQVQLIFHRGAKVRSDVEQFSFEDTTGLIQWITKDRGTITFRDAEEINRRKEDLQLVAKKWLNETRD